MASAAIAHDGSEDGAEEPERKPNHHPHPHLRRTDRHILISTKLLTTVGRAVASIALSACVGLIAWMVQEVIEYRQHALALESRIVAIESTRFDTSDALEAKIISDKEHAILHERITRIEGQLASSYADLAATLRAFANRQDRMESALDRIAESVGSKK